MKLKNILFIVILQLIVSDAKTMDYISSTSQDSTEDNRVDSDRASKTETKLDDLEKKLENIIPVLKDVIELKFFKMIEKLEDLINKKNDGNDKSQCNNLDEAVKNIENKLPALKNDINDKINELEKTIPDTLTGTIDLKFKALELQLQGIINNPTLTQSGNSSSNNLQNAQENMLEMKNKLNSVEAMLNNLKDNINCKSVTNYDPLGNIGNKLSVLESQGDNILEQIKKTREPCEHKSVDQSCKTKYVTGYNFDQYYPLDDTKFLSHVLYARDSNGVTNFQMNIAISAPADGIVKLSSAPNPGASDFVVEIVFGGNGNQNINIRRSPYVNYKGLIIKTNVPNVLSTSRFTEFYIKLTYGKLDIGLKNQSPLLTYTDDNFKQTRYISFSSWETTSATILYDCPIDK